MNENIYPLLFTPVLKDYIWGGRNLETKLGRQLPPGVIAESWEIAGHPAGSTIVKNGALVGKSLPEVLNLLGPDLAGSRSRAMLARGKFPLIIKLLDANKPLSVQVHPEDDYAGTYENGELGKTEMWYVLHADPNAYLIYGLTPGVTPESFKAHLETGNLESCLHKLPVRSGDAVFIPAGSIHALMDGIMVAEVLQNSDTTYRVYDWNRVGPDGKPRPLHIDKALEVTNFKQVEPGPCTPTLMETTPGLKRELITTCRYFNVERVTFTGETGYKGICNSATFEIWGIISGQAQIAWAGQPLTLSAVQFTLLPAALGQYEIRASPEATLLRITLPE